MSDESVDLGCLPNGAHLSRKPNGVGGYIYYSDEIGGGVLIWDTCLVSQHTLLCAISHENKRRFDKCVATDEVNKKKGFVGGTLNSKQIGSHYKGTWKHVL